MVICGWVHFKEKLNRFKNKENPNVQFLTNRRTCLTFPWIRSRSSLSSFFFRSFSQFFLLTQTSNTEPTAATQTTALFPTLWVSVCGHVPPEVSPHMFGLIDDLIHVLPLSFLSTLLQVLLSLLPVLFQLLLCEFLIWLKPTLLHLLSHRTWFHTKEETQLLFLKTVL